MSRSKWTFIILYFPIATWSQQCFNAGLETATLDGYATYLGRIRADGQVIIQDPGSNPERHRVMHISEGVDPIAQTYCTLNSQMPVVAPGGGQYALRLGNSRAGSEAERVVLSFTVTPELTFFLLRYAVVLNDPAHEPFEQPRFELRILDATGEVFPCGEYQVRAAENIPGFETCESGWRVRPWTTAGFELQSFLGQTIQIEILTTDCSQGGHAGYAYLDATCQPLEINLEGYCPDRSSAFLEVTEGFSSYLWNTGETTSSIEIRNPEPGTEYAVTVTSATGCNLVLRDTLPELMELPPPVFDPLPDTTVCSGSQLWVRPTGKNLYNVFCRELGYEADSFLLMSGLANTCTFIASDRYKCRYDSVRMEVGVYTPEVRADIRPPTCAGDADGRILLEGAGNTELRAFAWANGADEGLIQGLVAGNYAVTVTDARRCTLSTTLHVPSLPQLAGGAPSTDSTTCFGGSDGRIVLAPRGGLPPYSYYLAGHNPRGSIIDSLPAGSYEIEVEDSLGCRVRLLAEIDEPTPLTITTRVDSVTCFGGSDGRIEVMAAGGAPGYQYRFWSAGGQPVSGAAGLAAATYRVEVIDQKYCTANTEVEVHEPAAVESVLESIPASCHDSEDGQMTVRALGGSPPYTVLWGGNVSGSTPRITGLLPGVYSVTVTDSHGCADSAGGLVTAPAPVLLELKTDSVSCFDGQDGKIVVQAIGGTQPYLPAAWSPPLGKEGMLIENLRPGIYAARVLDANGCAGEAVTEIHQPEPIRFPSDQWFYPRCQASEPTFSSIVVEGGNGGYRYHWSNGAQTASVENFIVGTHTLTVTDQKQCTAEGPVDIREISLDIEISGSGTDLCLGEELKLAAVSSYPYRSFYWETNYPLTCDTCEKQTLTPFYSGSATAVIADFPGCEIRQTAEFTVDRNCGTFLPNVFSPDGDGNNDHFYVMESRGGLEIVDFRIFNRWGVLVYENAGECTVIGEPQCGWDGTNKGERVESGVYVYVVTLRFLGDERPVIIKGDVLLVR